MDESNTQELRGLLDERYKALRSGTNKVQRSQEVFNDIQSVFEPAYEDALLEVVFQNDVSISTISDLDRWADKWHKISRGIALIHDTTPDDFKVEGATKGSIILWLGVSLAIATAIGRISHIILGVSQHYYEVRKKAEEVRALNLSNEKIALELEAEADKIHSATVDKVMVEIETQFPVEGDQLNALKLSVELLEEFIAGGGELEICFNEERHPPEVDTEAANLVGILSSIKLLKDTEAQRAIGSRES